jgi:DDE superfamily endonuclease
VDQVIPSLTDLLAPFRPAFRAEAFEAFVAVTQAWFLCLGPRTLAEVWQFCVLQRVRHYCTIYDLFSRNRWEWDDLGKLLLGLLLVQFVPAGLVWLAVDDTLCHKRGQRVAYGGMFLDPVLSSKNRKTFRYAVNYVVLALVVGLPDRPDRSFALPILWRVFRKKGSAGHRKKTELARELAHLAATVLVDRRVYLVGDSAYINAPVLRDRPANLEVIGPLPLKAALYRVPGPVQPQRRGRPPKKGERLPTPREILALPEEFVAEERAFALPAGEKRLRVQVLRGVLWYSACKERRVAVVLVHDPSGSWRDEALLSTDLTLGVEAIVSGYARRWSIEVAFHDAKQYLGLHDPQVWCASSVERAHPLSFFCVSLAVLWYRQHGAGFPAVRRERPWYKRDGRVTFAALLGKLRLAIWEKSIFAETGDASCAPHLCEKLLHCLAAVR